MSAEGDGHRPPLQAEEDVAPDEAGNSGRGVATKMAHLRRCGIDLKDLLAVIFQERTMIFRQAGDLY